VGEVAEIISDMAAAREALGVAATGTGLTRALYATLLSHLPHDRFSYSVPAYGDPRGRFVEAVKTPDAGQLSYFTQVPGVERGGHYHHSKSEKFLVVRGAARFRFRHLLTGERVDVDATAEEPRIVDTIPGWAHDVVNLGNDELVVLVWANEVFDRSRPDTVPQRVIMS
jgi:UDP-2-acetamido-2,6-beta-L-arabino-hexul-4-ose reductase